MHPSSHCDRNAWPSSHCDGIAWPSTRQKGEMSTRHVRVKLMGQHKSAAPLSYIRRKRFPGQSRPIRLHAKFTATPLKPDRHEASCVVGSGGFNVEWWSGQDYPTVRLRMPHVSNYTNLKSNSECNGPLGSDRSRSLIRMRAFANLFRRFRDPNNTCRVVVRCASQDSGFFGLVVGH